MGRVLIYKYLGRSEVHVHVHTTYSVRLIWEISFSSAIKLHVFTVIIEGVICPFIEGVIWGPINRPTHPFDYDQNLDRYL